MNEAPPVLFKYVPPERVDILETDRIAFSPILRFNDPFDFHPTVATVTSRAHLRRAVKQNEWEKVIPKGAILKRKAKRNTLRELHRDLLQHMREEAEPIAAEIQARMLDQMNQRGGVLCLTTLRDSLLMWAHYAASHRGFVLEFDPVAASFRSLGALYKITYSAQRPVCDVTQKADLSWFLVKSREWGYEEEFRIIRELTHCEAIQKNGQTIHVCPLAKQAVKAVYLGVNMERAARERLMAVVRGTHIQVLQARLPRTKFGLDFQVVK